MTIANKLIIAFALLAVLILAAGGSGLYATHQLKNITQFIINDAWDTADGAMEGIIGIQKQVIEIEHALASGDTTQSAGQITEKLNDAQKMTTEALTRLTDAGLMEVSMINELNQHLSAFYLAQKNLLTNMFTPDIQKSELVSLNTIYAEKTKVLTNFLDEFETIADGKIEGQVSEVDGITSFVTKLIMATLLIGLCAAFAVSFVSKRLISDPIALVSKRLKEIAHGDGDLTVSLPVKGNDEISELSNSFNVFTSKIRDTISNVTQAAGRISDASDRMTSIANETNQSLNRQLSEIDQVASSTSEMSSTVDEVARNASAAASAANAANDEAIKGKDIVVASTHHIDSLAQQVKHTTDIISHLEDDSNAIGSILDVIKDIAEQTNLLALNAAIEAARAGEMGRGFAVVADEVRNLAQRTQESTQEIQEMIEKLQARAQNAARAMEDGQKQAQSTVERAHQAANALASISSAIASINDMNTQIAAAAEEQSAVTEEINRNITNITQQADNTSQASRKTADTGQELATLSDELNSCIRHFKLH